MCSIRLFPFFPTLLLTIMHLFQGENVRQLQGQTNHHTPLHSLVMFAVAGVNAGGAVRPHSPLLGFSKTAPAHSL